MTLSVQSLATSHLSEVVKIQPHGPYYLIGYSIGAFVAYEMANVLMSRGETIGLLAVVDIYNPALDHESTREAVQFRKRYRADRISKYLNALLKGDFRQIVTHISKSKILETKTKTIINKIFGAKYAAGKLRSYSPGKFPGRLVLFRVERPMGGGAEFEHDPSLGWRSQAEGGVDVNFVAGDHGTATKMPHVVDLANKLAPYLRDRHDR